MEISQYLDFDFLIRFLEGLQKFLGETSEILIHDYRKGYDHTIVYALNPAVSGRAVGGSPKGGMITQLGKDIEPMKDSIQTFSNGPKDRFYKSFTTLIPDENGKIVGSVCVNLDVSDLLNAQRALGDVCNFLCKQTVFFRQNVHQIAGNLRIRRKPGPIGMP